MVAPLKLPVRIRLLLFLHVAALVECSAFQSPDGDHTFVADGSGAALDAMSAGLAGAMRLLDTLHDIRGMLDELHVELDEIRQQQQLMRTEFEAMERRQSQDAGNEESGPFDRSPSGKPKRRTRVTHPQIKLCHLLI
jgi:hypothetical protein